MLVASRSKQYWNGILQVPDTGTRLLDNTKPFLSSSIVSFWITPAHYKECKYYIFRQYWYTKSVPVFTNTGTGTFQYLGPEVYFFLPAKYCGLPLASCFCYLIREPNHVCVRICDHVSRKKISLFLALNGNKMAANILAEILSSIPAPLRSFVVVALVVKRQKTTIHIA